MLVIRMRRTGSKKRPYYRVVVTERRSPREGRFIETLGFYNPRTRPAVVDVNKDRDRALDRAGRAAVGLGAHAAGAARDAGSRRRGAGDGRGGRAARRSGAAPWRSSKRWSRPWRGRWPTSPTRCEVTESERRGGLHFELHVAPGDLGRVIGRQGRTAAALRLLLAAAADVDGQRIQLDIRDSHGPALSRPRPGTTCCSWAWSRARRATRGKSSSTRRPTSPTSDSAPARQLWCRRGRCGGSKRLRVDAASGCTWGGRCSASTASAGIGEAERLPGAELRVPASARQRAAGARLYHPPAGRLWRSWTATGEHVGEVDGGRRRRRRDAPGGARRARRRGAGAARAGDLHGGSSAAGGST